MKTALGVFLLSLPFVVLAVDILRKGGLVDLLVVFGMTAAVVACMAAGVWLINL